MDAQIRRRFDDQATQPYLRAISGCLPLQVGGYQLRDSVVGQARFSIRPEATKFADESLRGIRPCKSKFAFRIGVPGFHPVVEPEQPLRFLELLREMRDWLCGHNSLTYR